MAANPADVNITAVVRQLSSSRRTDQLRAATAVGQLALNDSTTREALATTGCIPLLNQLLSSSSLAVQAQAAAALSAMSIASPALRAAVADSGPIPALIPLLSSSSLQAQAGAAMTLQAVTFEAPEQCEVILEAGGVAPLVHLCGSPRPAVRALAAGALRNLAHEPCSRATIAAAGAVPALVRLLSDSGSPEAAGEAAAALGNLMAQNNADMKAAVMAAGAPAALVLLARSSCSHEKALAGAAAALHHLAAGSDAGAAAADAGGAIAAMVELLSRSASPLVQGKAARALGAIALQSSERLARVVATGCIPHLVRLLGSSNGEQGQIVAASVLLDLTGSPEGACVAEAAAAAGTVPALAGVLQRSCSSQLLLIVFDLLHNLANHGLAGSLVAAGVLPSLDRLYQSSHQELREAAAEGGLQLLTALDPAAATMQASSSADAATAPQQRPPAEPRICAAPGCGATRGLRRCGGCGAVRYCGEACSKAHWRAHKAECRRLQAQQAAAAAAANQGTDA